MVSMNSNNCIVAFIDILGYKQMTEEHTPQQVYDDIVKLFEYESSLIKDEPESKKVIEETKLQVIGDSLIFVLDLENENLPLMPEKIKKYGIPKEYFYFQCFLIKICFFVIGLMNNPLYRFVRGGIVKGKYFQKSIKGNSENQFVFSEALSRAFMLEKDYAITPRILLGEDMEEYLFTLIRDDIPGWIEINRDEDDRPLVDVYSTQLRQQKRLLSRVKGI